ncbi:beta strand repeat-containing protein, partial [Aliarcobacter cryaerophilus]
MISRYIDNFDFKSRFRILKGGKVSLVVSAMIVSSSLVGTNANAVPVQVTGTTPYSSTLSENTDFAISNLFTTTAGESPFVINANGHNTNINITSNPSGGNSISINHHGVPKNLVGVNIINLGTNESSITTTDNYINIRNYKGEAFGISSKNGDDGGDWDNMTINIVSTIPEPEYGKYGLVVYGVGYAEGIYVDGDLKNSSISVDENSAFYISNADNTLTDAYGIDIGNNLENSTITNDGTFDISSNNGAYGIYVNDDVRNSQVINNGDMTIKVERDLVNADVQTEDSTNLYASGIEVNAVRQHTAPAGGTINISNSGNINASAIGNLTVDGNIDSGLGEGDYTNLAAEAKGITIGLLEGDGEVVGAIASFKNSDEITATSKLNLDFINQDDSINFNWAYFNATSTALEVDGSGAEIANTETGTISALAEINVDEKGTVSSYYLFAEANGIKSDNFENITFVNDGTIDSRAIFNGTSDAYSKSFGIYIDTEVSNASITSANIISKSDATATKGDAYARARGIDIYFLENGNIRNIDSIEVEAKSDGISESDSSAYGIVADDFRNSHITNEQTAELKITSISNSSEGISEASARGIFAYNVGDDFSITNIGNIEIVATANSYDYTIVDAYGIQIDDYGVYGDEGAVISNSGNINVKANGTIIDTVDGNMQLEAYGIKTGFDEESQLNITNSGTIEAYINNQLDKRAYSLHLGNSTNSDLNVTNSGILKGNIYVDGTLTNNGTTNNKSIIELAHNAMDEENAYISNFTNGEHGILKIGVLTDGTIGNTKYSQLNTQSAVFNDGSTIDVNVLSASTNQPLLAGKRLENIVTATTALTINDKLNITDNSALLNFKYVTSDGWTNGGSGAIHLDVVKSSENNIIDNTVSGGGNQNSQNAATALQNVYNSNPEIASAFNNLTSDQAVASAVQSTTALTPTASVGATTQISNGIAGIVTQRQNANISGGGLNSGDTMFAQKNFWFKP